MSFSSAYRNILKNNPQISVILLEESIYLMVEYSSKYHFTFLVEYLKDRWQWNSKY